jgi:GT2 family glycosyltransferase
MSDTRLPHVIVSVLNWNAAPTTLACLKSVIAQSTTGMAVELIVVDNGSEPNDWQALQAGLPAEVRTVRLDRNTGFAAGHNVVIREALARQADFIWLLNNDTIIPAGTLEELVVFMQRHPRCGCVSPFIYALHDDSLVDFCGAWHDWEALESRRPNDPARTRDMEQASPEQMWNHGTAPLFRLEALHSVGVLDERYFAYFEDDDIGVRLSRQGWLNQICHDTRIRHARRTMPATERPAYYFHLMARNSYLFWGQYTPTPLRRGMRRRLLCRALIEAAKLRDHEFPDKADACLTGAIDRLAGRSGPSRFGARPPAWIALAARMPYRILKRLAD